MSKSHGWLVLFGLCLGACNIETHHGDEPFDDEGCESSKPVAPLCKVDADCKAAEQCASGGKCVLKVEDGCASDAECANASYCDVELGHCVASVSCSAEIDCDERMNCDGTRSTCVPSAYPTCGEVANESDCVARADCSPLYAGVDCSCGPDCACQGGEPGCICESFEFFRCEPAVS